MCIVCMFNLTLMAEDCWYTSLKDSGVSTHWLHCLKYLASSDKFPIFFDRLLNSQKNIKHTDLDNESRPSTWEEILLQLVTTTVITVDKELCVVPVFVILPSQLQARFLNLLYQQRRKVCASSLSCFLSKLQELSKSGTWIYLLLQQFSTELKTISCHPYQFHNQSKLTSLLEKLKSRKNDNDESHLSTQQNTNDFPRSLHGEKDVFSNKDRETNFQYDTNKISNVIVVKDEDSDLDDILMSSQPISKDLNVQTYQSKKSDTEDNKAKLPDVKRQLKHVSEDLNSIENTVLKKIKLGAESDEDVASVSHQITNDSVIDRKNKSIVEEACVKDKQADNKSGSILLEDEKLLLATFFDTISSKEDHQLSPSASVWSLLQNCSKEKVEAACQFLHLSSLTDEKMGSICNSIPWGSLPCDTSLVLIQALFHNRVCQLRNQPSLTLVTAAQYVASCQAQCLLEVLTQVACQADSGIHQCQLLISLFERHLTTDTAEFLIRQVSCAGANLTEELAAVMLALLDRRPDLSPGALDNFLLFVSKPAPDCSRSATIGKLYMKFLNNYGKKLSLNQVECLTLSVVEHKSSLKRALTAALKKYTRV